MSGTVIEALAATAREHGARTALRWKRNGEWKTTTWAQRHRLLLIPDWYSTLLQDFVPRIQLSQSWRRLNCPIVNTKNFSPS